MKIVLTLGCDSLALGMEMSSLAENSRANRYLQHRGEHAGSLHPRVPDTHRVWNPLLRSHAAAARWQTPEVGERIMEALG